MSFDRVTLSRSDIAAYAGFWAWFDPPHESKLEWIKSGLGYQNLQEIEREASRIRHAKRIAAEVETFETIPEIKSYILGKSRERGSCRPEKADYSSFFKSALERKHTAFGKPLAPYNPKAGASGIKLQPAKAVRVHYAQEPYSDDSASAIPYVIEPGKPADLKVFQANVSELVSRANTHTGWAGSGCTYTVSFHDGFVIVHTRASIAD
jgi:hypothetical protein